MSSSFNFMRKARESMKMTIKSLKTTQVRSSSTTLKIGSRMEDLNMRNLKSGTIHLYTEEYMLLRILRRASRFYLFPKNKLSLLKWRWKVLLERK